MQRPLRRSNVLVSSVTIGLVLSVASSAGAQNRVRGETADEWDNPLEGVTVVAERVEGVIQPQTITTDANGRFLFVSLSPGRWSFTATLAGYQGLRQTVPIGGLGGAPPVTFEMAVLATGGRFRERTEFEADDGTLRFRFEEDGTFEFEDADGEGEGTYGIVELNAVLVVRDYDGPDDTFTIQTPVVVEFADHLFSSLTHDGVRLLKKQ